MVLVHPELAGVDEEPLRKAQRGRCSLWVPFVPLRSRHGGEGQSAGPSFRSRMEPHQVRVGVAAADDKNGRLPGELFEALVTPLDLRSREVLRIPPVLEVRDPGGPGARKIAAD